MSFENQQDAASKAASTILKNTGGDAILLIVVKGDGAIVVSQGTPLGAAHLLPAIEKAHESIVNKLTALVSGENQ